MKSHWLSSVNSLKQLNKYIRKAVTVEPSDTQSILALANVLLAQNRQQEAVDILKKAIDYSSRTGDKAALLELQNALGLIENENSGKD